eukprot:gene148-9765_t
MAKVGTLPEAASRTALTTKDIGNLAAETTVLEGRNNVEEAEGANDADKELSYDTDTEEGDSSDEIFDGSIAEISEMNMSYLDISLGLEGQLELTTEYFDDSSFEARGLINGYGLFVGL